MSGGAGKPRQTRLHVLLLAVKSHKKRLSASKIICDPAAATATVRTPPVLKLAFSAGGVEQRARRSVSV